MPDPEVLAWATREHRILLTIDKDFGELARGSGLPRTCGAVLLRMPMPKPEEAGQRHRVLTYVSCDHKVTYMEKTQVYLPREELEALRAAAARSGRSVAELIREAVRKTVLKTRSAGPVALWDGEPRRTSIEHDSVHDEP